MAKKEQNWPKSMKIAQNTTKNFPGVPADRRKYNSQIEIAQPSFQNHFQNSKTRRFLEADKIPQSKLFVWS